MTDHNPFTVMQSFLIVEVAEAIVRREDSLSFQ